MFKIENLTPLSNGKNSKVPCLFTFWNEDSDAVNVENFFSKDCGLKKGDQVIVISNDYSSRSNYYVKVNEDNYKITLIAQ